MMKVALILSVGVTLASSFTLTSRAGSGSGSGDYEYSGYDFKSGSDFSGSDYGSGSGFSGSDYYYNGSGSGFSGPDYYYYGSGSDYIVIHPKLFDSRGASEAAGTIQSISLSNIHNLQVRRYSFKDLKVTGIFYLGEVVMDSVVSMAFHFKFVKEFSVFASVFERISMFGVKIDYCREFNILGMTHFYTLAAHAIKVKCDKFSLAYNWFGNLHDSSFDVEFGLCDIQGNTFNTLQGKPFLSLAPKFR